MFLGMDVAKSCFEAASLDIEGKSRPKCLENIPNGFAALENWIGSIAVRDCGEATGTCSKSLALYLHKRDLTGSVVNPSIISAFRKSRMKRTNRYERCSDHCTLLPDVSLVTLDASGPESA